MISADDIRLLDAAAAALTTVLPTTSLLRAERADQHDGDATRAVVASFVGRRSADLAVVLDIVAPVSGGADGEGARTLTAADVVQPALEAASDVLGNGVLDDARLDDATDLCADPDAAVYRLVAADGVQGWFAIRLRREPQTGERSVLGRLSRINNVEMALTVEIGRTRMSVRDVLGIEPGAVIELDRSAGSPADVLLNGRLIAHGEIVVVDQDYAVRITKILDTAEDLD